MIKFIIFFALISFANAGENIQLQFSTSEVNQGEIISAQLSLIPADESDLLKVQGKTFAETIYILELTPLTKREGINKYIADTKVIFLKVPEENRVAASLNGKPVIVSWNTIKINPTEESSELLFGTFEISPRINWYVMLLGTILVLGLTWLLARMINTKIKLKKSIRLRKVEMKDKILGCRSFEEVVELWKDKHVLTQEFPHIKDAFFKLEESLNRYQFKPIQTNEEKSIVLESYRKFSKEIEGGFHGV